MGAGIPLVGIEFLVLFDLIVDSLRVVVGDVFIDDFLLVLREELLYIRTVLLAFLHHHSENQIKLNN